MIKKRSIGMKSSLNWRIVIIIIAVTVMLIALRMISTSGYTIVENGNADLLVNDYNQEKAVALNGQWEFYWDKLLTSQDFATENPPKLDSYRKVPGTWDEQVDGTRSYPKHGVATYRLILKYPTTMKDPALRVQSVATAYKLYANGQLITEVGTVSDQRSEFKDGIDSLIIDLPKGTGEMELIIQVANLNYAKGGLRESPVFGSKKVLENKKTILFTLQLLFIGSVLIFAIYYMFLFLLQRKNKSLLLFSILCFITVVRTLLWGTTTSVLLFYNMPYHVSVFINYLTGYNMIPMMVLFIISLYPHEHNKIITGILLIPTLLFDLLLFTPTGFMSLFTNYVYLLTLLQMIYIISIMIIAVLRKKENAIIMFIAVCIYVFTIIQDILYYKGMSSFDVYLLYIYGSYAVILAMAFVQARLQSNINKKLVLYNEKLVEADRLKDKIRETEMSFLQAQIKPHFLYNSLDAIANVCEEDGEKASGLIVDLSVYLRRSLEFNGLDKMMSIEKELEFVETYFNIEQARFGQKISLQEEIEISLDKQLPVLILQPLVENAIRHGISKRQQGGTVSIRAKQLTEGISIEVEDDGIGIEEEKLSQLLSDERKDKGIGFLNIHNRLLSLYGTGLEITSEVGKGTCVRFIILEGAHKDDTDSSS